MALYIGTAEIDGRTWTALDVIASDPNAARQAIADLAATKLGAHVVVVHNLARALPTFADGEVSQA